MTMPVEYACIKSAIVHLTKYMAKYFKGQNIRFNCISPGGIFADQPQDFIKNYNKYALSKGILNKEDIVGTVIFLLSDTSKFINGQNIVVDDGWSL
jgi:NAD(P)-dependent dehydrogenase (short-subunit alcohol dehydrogenase family)